MIERNLTPIIENSFLQFSGAVLQSRALVDVRDCIKPSARQIFYCMYTDKFIHSKPFQKTLKAIGSAFRLYIHGDSSAEGVIMRAGQPFAMRYPLVEVEGSYGTLMSAGSWAAPRYTAARLSPLAEYLFADLQKDTINEWRDNYDDTEQYPAVLPSKGFYNLVNGTYGIGVGASSSIPQYNLRELNNALITLIKNPNASFDEIYCVPDFATGAILINPDQVKESHKNGTGFACKLRAVVEWDQKERCFIVSEIPYMLYTETICKELEEIINSEDNFGIDRFIDLTGTQVNIKIYLTKTANPDKVLKRLYKETSLESYYGINFTMLLDGRFPQVFTWRDILQAHINHEREVYYKGFQFDLRKIRDRIHIIEGLLKCTARIEEVVQTIKTSSSTSAAAHNLCEKFELTEVQAKAVLDMKLSKLAHLEIEKLEKEKIELEGKAIELQKILDSKELLDNEVIKGLEEVSKKFGDARRTKIINLQNEGDEPIEVKSLMLNLTNQNNLFVTEASTLYTQRRGGVGNKFKVDKGEYIIDSTQGQTTDRILFFSNLGNVFYYTAADLSLNEKISVAALFDLKQNEHITALIALTKDCDKEYIIFFTKQGYMKKSLLSEYTTVRKGGVKALELNVQDEIVSIVFTTKGKVGILTEQGQFLICRTDDVRPIGRVARGVRGIKLNEGDGVMSARTIPEFTTQIVSISNQGYIKRTSIGDFPQANRYTKGSKIQKLHDDEDWISDFLPIVNENEVVIASSRAQIRVKVTEIPDLSKGAQGVKSISITPLDHIIGLSKF